MCNRENIVHFKTLSYDEFLRIVESVNPQFISMHGYGEPLLNPDLFRMIKYVSDRKIKNTITSNAVLLNKNNLQKLNDCGLDLLKISIDTLNKNNFYKIRGIENFDTVIENIKNARSYNYKFDIRLSFTVLHFNYYEMSEFINFAADSGFDKVYFQPLLFYNSILKKRDYGNIDKTDFLKIIMYL
jgi:MoaA/NifB/PqqE/SkfB family radical SAM enzyme